VILNFAPLLSTRVFEHARLLIVGASWAPGKRTVTSILRVMGLGDTPHFQTAHRVLKRAKWSALQGRRSLLMPLVKAFAATGAMLIGGDETIERRWGTCISARGIDRDPVRSSNSPVVKASGLRWVSLRLLAPVPWAKRLWALPLLTGSSPSECSYQRRGRPGQPLLKRAAPAIGVVKRWLPAHALRIVADNPSSALEWLATVRPMATVSTRLRLDAALYEPAVAARTKGPTAQER
jgi:hypothetical protein